MRRLPIAGGWYGEALTGGQFAVLVPAFQSGQIQRPALIHTHAGDISLPDGETGCLFVRCWQGPGDDFRVAGQSWVGSGTLEHSGASWRVVGPSCGVSPVIYRADGVLAVNSHCEDGSQGYRYWPTGADRPVTGDLSYRHPTEQLWEYTQAGDVLIGQGELGAVIIADGTRRMLESGDCRWIRANRSGNTFAVAIVKQLTHETVLYWFDRDEIAQFPLDNPVPVPVPTPVPVPVPVPTPMPNPTTFDWNTVVISGSPDVRNWRETTQLTSLNLQHDGVYPEFGARASWPESGDERAGRIQFTLWIAMFDGVWRAVGAIPFWTGLPRAGGDIVKEDLIVTNWGMSRRPNVGEKVGFFVTQGDARKKDLHTLAERSNIVFVDFPADYKLFTFGSVPVPVPDPVPVPVPTPPAPVEDLKPRVEQLEQAVQVLAQVCEMLHSQLAELAAKPAPKLAVDKTKLFGTTYVKDVRLV